MLTAPVRAHKYGFDVWENPTLEAIRPDECLCLNCSNLKPGLPENCEIAAALFSVSKQHGVAFPLSRCPKFTMQI